MPYTGRCACGLVTASIQGEPFAVGQCWCRQCQRVSAGSASNNALFQKEEVVTSGELAIHTYRADSGNTSIQSFCAGCGTPVLGASSAHPGVIAVKLGIIDEPHGLRPAVAMWTSEAPAWALIDPSLPQFAKLPPLPAQG
jgi:hypothetical protein